MLITGCPFPVKQEQNKEQNQEQSTANITLTQDEQKAKINKFVTERTLDRLIFFAENEGRLSKQQIEGLVEEIKSFKDDYNDQIKYILQVQESERSQKRIFPMISMFNIVWDPTDVVDFVLKEHNLNSKMIQKDVNRNKSSSKYIEIYNRVTKTDTLNMLSFYYYVLNYPEIKNSPKELAETKDHFDIFIKANIARLDSYNCDKSLLVGQDSLYSKLFPNE